MGVVFGEESERVMVGLFFEGLGVGRELAW